MHRLLREAMNGRTVLTTVSGLTLEDIWTGLQDCYRDLAVDVKKQYDVELTTVRHLDSVL